MEKQEFNKNTTLKINPHVYIVLFSSSLLHFTANLLQFDFPLQLHSSATARDKEAKILVHGGWGLWRCGRDSGQGAKVTETEKDQQSASSSEKATKKFCFKMDCIIGDKFKEQKDPFN